jgi:hypothetical protein
MTRSTALADPWPRSDPSISGCRPRDLGGAFRLSGWPRPAPAAPRPCSPVWGSRRPDRAARLLSDPALAGLIDPLDDSFADGPIQALADVADPDLALLSLVRLMEALRARIKRGPR